MSSQEKKCASCGAVDHFCSSSKNCLKYQPPRRKRGGVEEVKDFRITTIKTTLRNYCANKVVLDKIKSDVSEMSPLLIETSIYINFRLQRDWSNGIFPQKPYEFLPYYYELLGKSMGKYRLDEEYSKLRHPRDLYDKSYRSNLFVAKAKQFETIFHNNLWMHGRHRVSRFFSRFTKDKKSINKTVDYLFNAKSQHTPSSMLLDKAELHLAYKVTSNTRFLDIKNAKQYYKYVEFFYSLLKFNRENNLKGFILVPQLKHGLHHFTYDSFAFYNLLCSVKLFKGKAAEMPNEEWYKYFPKCRELERKGKLGFGFKIKTDGISISFSMNRYDAENQSYPPSKKKKQQIEPNNHLKKIRKRYANNEYQCIIGLDPGLKLMYGGVRIIGEKTERIKITSSHFHHLAGKRKETDDGLKASTVEPFDFVAYTQHRLDQFEDKQKIYSTWRNTRAKFEQFQGYERASAALARQLIDGGDTQRLKNGKIKNVNLPPTNKHRSLVFIGDTTIAGYSPIRRYLRTANRQVIKHLQQIADIVRVNEFRTTKLCSQCFEPANTSKSPHRYQVCQNCGIVWNRDVNAGNNILQLGLQHYILEKEKPPISQFAKKK